MFDDTSYRRANDAIHAPAELKERARQQSVPSSQNRKPRRWLPRAGGLVAAAVAVALLFQLSPGGGGSPASGGSFASAAYVAEYPDVLEWEDFYGNRTDPDFDYDASGQAWDNYRASIRADGDYLSSLSGFTLRSARAALAGLEDRTNGTYSPLALYMALSMAAELSGSSTRQQVLDALGVSNLSVLREQTGRIWNSVHRDSKVSQSLLANSLWLSGREEYQFKDAPLLTLRDSYYASTYVSDMGSQDTLNAIHDWLNRQTGNTLTGQVEEVNVDAGTVALLLSTVYFHDQWVNQFSEEKTAPDTFHLANGGETTCDFMHMDLLGSYVAAEGFTSTSLSFEGSGSMTFILPDEDRTVDDLLADNSLMERILSNSDDDPDRAYGEIQLSVPKFSVSSTLDLIPILTELGITELFDFTAADFTPLSDCPELYIDRATQSTIVSIDEVGCTASSFVEMELRCGAGFPDGLCVLNLNRPFLFVISGVDHVPLFIGVVNDPTV